MRVRVHPVVRPECLHAGVVGHFDGHPLRPAVLSCRDCGGCWPTHEPVPASALIALWVPQGLRPERVPQRPVAGGCGYIQLVALSLRLGHGLPDMMSSAAVLLAAWERDTTPAGRTRPDVLGLLTDWFPGTSLYAAGQSAARADMEGVVQRGTSYHDALPTERGWTMLEQLPLQQPVVTGSRRA